MKKEFILTTLYFVILFFGGFGFEEVEAGQTYIIDVRSKRQQFTPQVLTINEDVTELNLTANE